MSETPTIPDATQFDITALPDHVSKRFSYYDRREDKTHAEHYGCYTQAATSKDDEKPMYHSFAMYLSGEGSRSDKSKLPKKHVVMYLKGSLAAHKTKKAAIQRAQNLTNGVSLKTPKVSRDKADVPPNYGYCLKEKQVRPMYDLTRATMKNGRSSILGKCEFCDAKIVKIGKLVDCTACNRLSEADPNDYICKECRE